MEKTKEWNTFLFLLKYGDALEWESRFTLALNAAKNIDYIEKCSNKICSWLNFLQKVQWTHISIYPRSGAWGLWRYHFLNNTQECESVFTLWNTAKDIDYIEKQFKQKLRNIKFPTKNSVEAYLYLP